MWGQHFFISGNPPLLWRPSTDEARLIPFPEDCLLMARVLRCWAHLWDTRSVSCRLVLRYLDALFKVVHTERWASGLLSLSPGTLSGMNSRREGRGGHGHPLRCTLPKTEFQLSLPCQPAFLILRAEGGRKINMGSLTLNLGFLG